MNKLLQEKFDKILKDLRSQEPNKKCMDCKATFPGYVVLDYGSWVCATCSGIHREFNHRVKSPSMASFKPEEIKFLQQRGNDVVEKEWRVGCKVPKPDPSDVTEIRNFIRDTYELKKWYRPSSSSVAPPSSTNPSFISIKDTSTTSFSQPSTTKEEYLISFDDLPTISNPEQPTSILQPFNPFLDINETSSTNPFSPQPSAPKPTLTKSQSEFLSPSTFGNNESSSEASSAKQTSDASLFRLQSPPSVTLNKNSRRNSSDFKSNTALAFNTEPPSLDKHFNHLSVKEKSLSSPSLSPSPPSSRSSPPSNPTPSNPPPSNPTPSSNENCCPICFREFIKGISNDTINRHLDECLANGRSDIGIDKKPTVPVSNSPDPWSQWFDLSKMDWYFGNIDRKRAEGVLKKCENDSFLVRKSSKTESYAVSLWNAKKRTLTHALIEPNPKGGYSFQGSFVRYSTIKELIEKSPECKGLKPPPKTFLEE